MDNVLADRRNMKGAEFVESVPAAVNDLSGARSLFECNAIILLMFGLLLFNYL